MPHQFRHEDFFDDARMPVVVHRRVSQRPSRLHSHAFSELVIVLSGQGVHFTVDDEHDVMAGDVFVIQGSGEHGYRNPRQLELVNIMFKPGQLDLPLHDLRSLPGYHALFTLEPRFRKQHRFSSRLHLDSHQLSYLAPMIDALERECTERPPGFLAMSVVSFMQIVGYLSRCYGQVQTAASRPLLRIGEALGHLEDHYAEPIDIARLARIAHMSESSLYRAFKRGVGHTPIHHLIRLRIRKACPLLRRSDRSMSAVAVGVGFSDSNYFSRQFRNIMGISPREYRRRSILPPAPSV